MQFLPMALAIASTVTSFAGQQQQANAQESQNNELRQNALEARNLDLQTIEDRRQQEQDAAGQKLQQSQEQALQERSSDLAAQSQAGQSGLSVNALLNDHLRQSLNNETIITQNLSDVNKQLDLERQRVQNQAVGRVNSAPPVTEPSFLGAALKIGDDAVSYAPKLVKKQYGWTS